MRLDQATRRGMYQTILNMKSELEMHCNTHYARIESAQKTIRESQEMLEKLETEFIKVNTLLESLKSKIN